MLPTTTSSPLVVRASATANAQHHTPSETVNNPSATPIAAASRASTPMAAGIAVAANTAFPIQDAAMILPPGSGSREATA
jgi:hypothetical protein